ncbi:MAG: hypothetical protein JW797_16310 [Bradymonadales bacterium]|nr:hypothetical protein [Bradymonadales bacterium]
MAQQVEFPKIPGTTPDNFEPTIKGILGYVVRESPTDKDLRRYLRSRSLYDDTTASLLFELLGMTVKKGEPVTLAEFGRKLHDTDDSEAWQDLLFKRLAGRNEILVKFVFDALFERLYSVNEMYRGVTSYAYPGTYITLPNFQNWMLWIQATGMVKYIGIRWGPSDKAKAMVSYFDSIDIEELLEEEAEEREGEEGEEGQEEKQEKGAPAADQAVEPESPAPPGDEEEPGHPPSAESAPAPASPAVKPAPPAAAPASATGEVTPVPAMEQAQFATYQSVLTLRSVAEIREVQKVLELDPASAELARRAMEMDDAEIAHNLEGLQGLWGTAADKTILGFSQFGLDPEEYRKEVRKKTRKGFFLYRALVAATCAFRPIALTGSTISPPFSPTRLFEILDKSGALQQHYEKKASIDTVITGLVEAAHGERLDVLAMTPYLVLARQGLLDAEEWAAEQEQAEIDEAVWEAVYERLHAGVFTQELIWLVREMSRSGLWPLPELKEVGVIPTQEVLDITFRIGLLPTPYLVGFTASLWASRVLTGFCPETCGYEAGYQHFGRQLGCSYNCPNRATCRFFCREKLRR